MDSSSRSLIFRYKGKSYFRFILLLLLVFLIGVLVLGIFLLDREDNNDLFNTSDIQYSNEQVQQKFDEFVNKSSNTNDPDEKADLLAQAFLVMSAEYDRAPSHEKRELLAKMHEMLSSEFPEVVESERLSVPCREEECGAKFVYNDTMADMKNIIVNLQVEENVRDSLLHNLENASLAQGAGSSVDTYNALAVNFSILRVVWGQKKDKNIKLLIDMTLKELELLNPERYKKGTEHNLFSL